MDDKATVGEKTFKRPYSAKVVARGNRLQGIKDTLEYLKRCEVALSRVHAASGAFMTPEIASQFKKKEEDSSVCCTITRFRLVPVGSEATISAVNLKAYFRAALGELNPLQEAYLFSSFDSEKYAWQDTLVLARLLAADAGITEEQLREFSQSMILNQCLVNCAGGPGASNAISAIFGDGVKANYSQRSQMIKAVYDAWIANNPETLEDARAMAFLATGTKTVEEFANLYGKQGRKSTLVLFMESEINGKFASVKLKYLLEKLEKDADKNGRKKILPYREAIAKWLRNATGADIQFNALAWAEAYSASVSEYNSSYSHNLIFASKKASDLAQAEELLRENPQTKNAISVFDSYMNMFDEDLRFVVYSYHLGDLAKFQAQMMHVSESEYDAAFKAMWEDYLSGLEYGEKPAICALVRHVLTQAQDIPVSAFKAACKYLNLNHQINNRNPHPFVSGSKGYTFGRKNLWAEINDPKMIFGTNQISGSRSMMWARLETLDKGKWVLHDMPFTSSRYFEEVYYTDISLPTLDKARDGKHGYRLGKKLDEAARTRVRENNLQKKAAKAIERIKANCEHNVLWDPTTTFMLQLRDNEVAMTINHRHRAQKAPKEIEVGDRLIGIDQNETAPTTYAILERTDDSKDLRVGDKYFRVIKMDNVVAPIKTKYRTVDALTYDGVALADNASGASQFVKTCSDFFEAHGDKEGKESLARGMKWTTSLYSFHGMYFKNLSGLMRRASKAKGDLQVFRDHLQEILFRSSLSPLRVHSLSLSSMNSTQKVISCINSYLSLRGWKTDQDRTTNDRALWEASLNLYGSLVNRRKERVRLTAGILIRACLDNGVRFIHVEDELPVIEKGKSKQHNSSKMHWCGRELSSRLKQMAEVAGIKFSSVKPHFTSHQDPFVHSSQKKAMRARWNWRTRNSFNDKDAERIRTMLNGEDSGTKVYYRAALAEFAKKYGLDLAEMRKRRDAQWYIERLPERFIVPQRGGRIYLSTHDFGSCEKIEGVYGSCAFANNADQIAALNVALVIL